MASEQAKRAFSAKVLGEIAADTSGKVSAEDRIKAAEALVYTSTPVLSQITASNVAVPRWYDVDTKDLAIFFLKVVVAGAPAMLLSVFLYIAVAMFTQIAPVLMGL